MKKYRNFFYILILFISSFLIFNSLEFELLNQAVNKYIQSFIFSTTLIICIFKQQFRTSLFYLSLFFIFLAFVLYLVNQFMLSNSLSSLGIGILFITLLSYLPKIVKIGYTEKL